MIDCPIIDTHVHICDSVFDRDRGVVLARAQMAGIAACVAVSETLAEARRNLELATVYPLLRPAAGLYPTYLDLQQAAAIADFIRQERERLVAIGEVGLDFWAVRDEEAQAVQRRIFADFIDLAGELDLPLNVHSRSAGRHAVALLLERGASRVQLHAFDGKISAAMPAVAAGYYFSIPPSLVRSRQKQKLVKQLPLSCLLVETDSPVLGPTPAERNEPGNAVVAIRAIAELKGLTEAEVARALMDNCRRLYGAIIP